MGTRGYLIFKYKGIYYVIYNHWDSYVSCMGVNNAKVIKALCKKFNGNIVLAREYLGNIIEKIRFVREDQGAQLLRELREQSCEQVLESTCDGFDIDAMSKPNVFALCEMDPTATSPKLHSFYIEYLWEVDLDAGTFGMGTGRSKEIFVRWPWKALYLLPINDFQTEAEKHKDKLDEGYLLSKTIFEIVYKTILIQACVRRFLAMRKALQPPNGIIYLFAKKRFEALQQMQSANANSSVE